MAITPDHFHPELGRAEGAEVTRLVGEIDEFKGHWRKLGEIQAERLARLRQATVIESSGSSTRIEGARLSDDEVSRVLQGLRVDSFRERDESEVRGYAALLQTIFDSYREISLTENHVKQLHGILLGGTEKDSWHRGEYKKHPNHVEATHPDGTKEVIFETAAPFDTPRLMSELVAATNEALAAGQAPALICIARFIVEFLAIHPFQDGNGRLARALTALLLLKAGYEYVPYSSLERLIEDNKAGYYAALRTSQMAMRQDPYAFGAWLQFFLRMLQAHQSILEAKLEVERSVLRLSDAQRNVLGLVESRGRITTTELATALGIPRRTIHYHLDILVQRGLVEPKGERKGRYYLRGTGTTLPKTDVGSWNTAVLAEILERGGAVTARELRGLLKQHKVDPRAAGGLHGRRAAHLRRDPKTKKSVLTPRGRELAEQYLFARRLSRGPLEGPDAPEGRRG